MQNICFGLEIQVGTDAPTQHWFPDQAQRDQSIADTAAWLRSVANNREVLVRKALKLPDDTVYLADGKPALHVRWRRTQLRLSCRHTPWSRHLEQIAVVELMSGQVVVADRETPFNASQYIEWSSDPCVREYSAAYRGINILDVALRPARAGEDCHYMVTDGTGLDLMRRVSSPSVHILRLTRPQD